MEEPEEGLGRLAAQYFQVVDIQHLQFPPNTVLLKPLVQEWIARNMFDETTVWPIPPLNYRSRVLKLLLLKIEQTISDPEEDEISDDLMAIWGDLVARPKPSPLQEAQKLSYIKYTPPKVQGCQTGQPIITSENRGLILSSGTTGFRTWEASLHLATFLSTPEGKSLVSGKSLLELGAGTGLVSMYCIKCLDANTAIVTDREPTLIANAQDCIARNGLDPRKIEACIWEWGGPLNNSKYMQEQGLSHAIDTALGADLGRHGGGYLIPGVFRGHLQIYDVDLVPLLVSTLEDLFDNYSLKQFVLSATLRNQETFNTFLAACETKRWNVVQLGFESPPAGSQDAFFHPTDVPIRTYRICQ
ncbi:hypothetical protein FQN57_000748 [Myotisia sp. PD_48]|nr:hypothetical protein FQN57_000748 [Myotisia sp. PD_48]